MLSTSTSTHLSTAKMHSKFTTLTFLQGQAIYQILHILVSITQPIVESGCFSRFIWPSRGGRVFLLNTPSPKHDWALLSAQTLSSPAATDGKREIVRLLETELRVSSHNCLSQFLFSSCLLALFSFPGLFQRQTQSIILHAPSFSSPHLSEALQWWRVLYHVASLFIPLLVSLTTPLYPFLSHVTPLWLSWSLRPFLCLAPSPSISLCGRVVINPYFIAGEFLSPCRADSSPRSKTLLGPNPILPPSITPSLRPSGPDYYESGRVVVRGEETQEGGITLLHSRRGKGERTGGMEGVDDGAEEERLKWGRTPERENKENKDVQSNKRDGTVVSGLNETEEKGKGENVKLCTILVKRSSAEVAEI